MYMKKTLLAASMAAAMGVAATAEAAFTPLGPGDYSISITGGCFAFGPCNYVGDSSGTGEFTDNTAGEATTSVTAAIAQNTRAIGATIGSGTVGGTNGTIEFSVDAAGDMTVTSYAQDSYLATAGGTFFVDALDTSLMSGNINGVGGITFTPAGREGNAIGFYTAIGTAPWNIIPDDAVTTETAYSSFTTGTQSAVKGKSSVSMTGSVLQDSGINSWEGVIVSADKINGQYWFGFDNTLYTEQFNVDVTLVLGLPNAVDDLVITSPSTLVVIDIEADLLDGGAGGIADSHADQTETIDFDSFTVPVSGAGTTLVLDANASTMGTLTYTPNAALTGVNADSFTYTIIDGVGATSTATVNINVATGTPPVAIADDNLPAGENNLPALDEDTPLTFDPILNDTDVDPDTLVLFNFADGNTLNLGSYTTPGGNDITYTPAANFSGTDTFTYQVHDGNGNVVTGTVTIVVDPVNDAPVCDDISFTTAVDAPLTFDETNDLLSTCTDVDAGTTSVTVDATSANGVTLVTDGAGSWTYTPVSGFQGVDTVSYTATDGVTASVPNTITINVANPLASNFTMLGKTGEPAGGTNDVTIEWDKVSVNSNDVDANGIATDTSYGIMTIASPTVFFSFNWFAHHVRIFRNPASATDPITLKFDTTCTVADYGSDSSSNSGGTVFCNGPLDDQQQEENRFVTLTLEPGEIGAHILFDWGSSPQATICGLAACNIDVINKWEENGVWSNPDGQVGDANTPDATLLNDLWVGLAGVPPALDTTWRLVSIDVDGDGLNGWPMVDGPFKGFNANFNYEPNSSGGGLAPIDTEIEGVNVDAFSMEIWSMLAGLFSVFGLRRINNKK